jgi:Asp-tRNA(Asn)/Glu-tRNA(Gln) amidotransferase A subunit family amidase
VLRPSSYCGIIGFKPTYGLLSMDGVMPFARSLDTLGIHAKHIDNIEAVFQALTDTSDDHVIQTAQSFADKQHIRLAWFPGYDAPMASDDAVLVLEQAREKWSGKNGKKTSHPSVIIEPIELSESLFALLGQANHLIMIFEGSKVHQKEYQSHRELLGRSTIEMIEEGMQISESDYQDALRHAQACRTEYRQKMQNIDALMTFSAPGEAPLWEQGTGSGVFNRLWTTIGSPAITLPIGHGHTHLPIGVQLVGHHHQDWALLALSRVMSQI